MYSESPSKDCFPFNDQSLSDVMPGMNEINNQTNLDYIFDSYYSSASRCNTGFELLEDCKNMSFSELFDQELFSSQENKDCKVPIKIEKEEEPLQPCYSTDITQDTTNSHPLTQIEENVPSPLLAKRFAPKRGINRTSIKTTNNCDVQHLLYHPFCETEDLSIDQPLVNIKLPNIKCEPEDAKDFVEQNMVDLQVKLCHSDDSQNTANGLGFDKVVDNGSSSLFKCSTLKRQGIKRTFIKTNRKSDIQQLMYNPFCETEDLIIKQPLMKIQVPIVKLEPEDVNDAVEQNVANLQLKQCHIGDLQNTTGQSLVKIDRRSSSLSKNSTPKSQQHHVNKMSTNCNVDRLLYCKTAQSLGIDQTPALVNMRIVKQEPEDFNDTVEHNIVGARPCYSEDSQNTVNGLGFDKVVDSGSSSLFQCSTPKLQGIKRTFIKTNRKSDVQHLMDNPFSETEGLIIKQPLMKINVPIIKLEPEDIDDAVEKNIANVQLKQCHIGDLQNTTGQSLVKINQRSSSSLSKNFTPKLQHRVNKTSKNCKLDRFVHCKTAESLGIDQTPALVDMRIVKQEPEDFNDTVEQNIVGAKPCYSENSQNTVNGLGFDKVVDNSSSLLFQSSTPKRQGIKRTFIKMNRKSDVQHLMDNPFSETEGLIIKQPLMKIKVPIVKLEPEDVNDAVEQDIANAQLKQCHIDDLQNTTGRSLIKIDRRSSSSLSKNSTPKPQQHRVNKTSQNCNVDRFVHCKTAESLGIDQTSALVNMRIVKQEPKDFNDTVEQNIVCIRPCYSEDSQNTTSHSLKIGEHFSSSLLKNSAPKRQHINDNKKSKRCNVDRLVYSNMEGLDIDQTSKIVEMPIVKAKTKDINDAIEQNIVGVKGESCFDNSQNIANSRGFVNGTDLDLKHQIINGTFLKKINNCHVNQLIYGSYCKTQKIGIDQMSVKVESPIVKCEPQSGADAIEQNNIKMDIVTKNESENEFGCINLNNTNVDNKDIFIIKGQDILSNGISLKNDNVSSQTFTISNQINLENEKKKISWEEFRAKKGKLGYFKKFGNKGKSGASEIIIDDDKMEAMMKEFDQNTAIYLGQKKKIEDKEEQNTNAKKMRNVEDEELEKNRMKIEYIKKLLPSSFASEIAKTSSLMKGNLVEEIENEITSDDSIMSSDKINAKYTDSAYLKKDKLQKKDHLSRIHSSRRSSRSDYNNCNNSSRSSSTSSSNPDDYYNRNKGHNAIQQDVLQYGKNLRNNTVPRSQEQKKVVYVGQIPIRFGKRYLYNRFKEFGQIQSLTLHKKPDFRVYYAFVTYSEYSEALRAINHGNHDQSQVQFDIRFGERKQAQTPYYDLDDEWLTDWYGYDNQPLAVVRKPQSPERDASFEEELQEFYKLAQIKKSKKNKSSQVS